MRVVVREMSKESVSVHLAMVNIYRVSLLSTPQTRHFPYQSAGLINAKASCHCHIRATTYIKDNYD